MFGKQKTKLGVEIILPPDKISLPARLRHVEYRNKIKASILVLPLLLFIVVTFVTPIASMLFVSIKNPEIGEALPRTVAAMEMWDGKELPDEKTLTAFALDMNEAKKARTVGKAGRRLNYDIPGFRSLMSKTARRIPPSDTPNLLQELKKIDKRWGEIRYWAAIKKASPPYTQFYLLRSVDYSFDLEGNIFHAPPEKSIYIGLLKRTLWMSFIVTVVCLLLGYPVAYLLATVPKKHSNLLMILVLLPLWTSLLVRTTAWVVLLQTQGVINDAAMALHLWSERVPLIYNRIGVYIAMVHILLPFMILPIYAVMRGIPPMYMHAAASLGANPLQSFLRVYMPQTIPGIAAGVLLVFVISLGYYITPALVGGPKDQMLSYFIAFHANTVLNWGMAAALSVTLLFCVLIFFGIFNRLVDLNKIKME